MNIRIVSISALLIILPLYLYSSQTIITTRHSREQLQATTNAMMSGVPLTVEQYSVATTDLLPAFETTLIKNECSQKEYVTLQSLVSNALAVRPVGLIPADGIAYFLKLQQLQGLFTHTKTEAPLTLITKSSACKLIVPLVTTISSILIFVICMHVLQGA